MAASHEATTDAQGCIALIGYAAVNWIGSKPECAEVLPFRASGRARLASPYENGRGEHRPFGWPLPEGSVRLDFMGRLIAIAYRDASKAPMTTLQRAEISVQSGVESDFRGTPGPRQVSVLARESWEAACNELGDKPLDWTLRRANLLVEGLDLEDSVGSHLRIGGLILKITGECDPCRVMDLQHQGLRATLVSSWRGGVTCRVRASGIVRVGDVVELEKIVTSPAPERGEYAQSEA